LKLFQSPLVSLGTPTAPPWGFSRPNSQRQPSPARPLGKFFPAAAKIPKNATKTFTYPL
jgi:hypothetical protein